VPVVKEGREEKQAVKIARITLIMLIKGIHRILRKLYSDYYYFNLIPITIFPHLI